MAARQHGVITVGQLLALGLTDGAIARRAARGVLHRRHRGVYAVGQPRLSREGEWLAAALAAGPLAALAHLSACEFYAVGRFRSPLIAVVSTRRCRLEGVRVHTVRRLDPRDVTTHRGIPVTTVHRLLVDLTDILTAHQLTNVIHEAAFRGRYVEAAVRDVMAPRQRPPQPPRPRARHGAVRRRQRRDEERRRGRVAPAGCRRAARQRRPARLRGRLPLAATQTRRRDRWSRARPSAVGRRRRAARPDAARRGLHDPALHRRRRPPAAALGR